MKTLSLPTNFAPWHRFILIVVAIVLLIVMVWANINFAEQNPGGNDFLPRYVGTRMFVINGWSPYSDQTGEKIQEMIFGRPARENEDQSLFAYPFYASLVFFPFSLVSDYTIARGLWMTFLEVIIIAMAILSMRLANWRPSFWLVPFYLIFSMLWYHGIRPVINGNAVLVVAFLFVGAFAAIQHQKDIVAGVLLACATIKPQLAILPILFVFLWAISQKRWKLIASTFIGVMSLVLIGMLFIPDWPIQNILAIMRYPDYTSALTLGSVIEGWSPDFGTPLRWVLTISLIFLTIYEWLSAYGEDFNHFLWTTCLTLAVSQWIGIATDPGNFIILFLPIVVIFAGLRKQWGKIGDWIVLISIFALFLGLWFLFLITIEYTNQPSQHPVMFIPLPLCVFIGLYYVRRWVFHPHNKIRRDNNFETST